MRDSPHLDLVRMTAVTLTIALVAAGCDVPLGAPDVPDEVVAPSTVGVITDLAQQDDGVLATLDDGSTVLLPIGARDLIGGPEIGRLLIVGEGGPAESTEGVWYAALRALPSGCFDLPVNGEVRGERMALSVGFSLPLSDTWSETETRFVNSPPVGFCLDESGAVVRP